MDVRLNHLQLCMCSHATYDIVYRPAARGVSLNSVVTTQSRLVRVTCRCHDHVPPPPLTPPIPPPPHLSDTLGVFPVHATAMH